MNCAVLNFNNAILESNFLFLSVKRPDDERTCDQRNKVGVFGQDIKNTCIIF